MTDLETMQREGREGFDVDTEDTHDVNDEIGYRMADYLDQHTANTWKAAQESMTLEGLLAILDDRYQQHEEEHD